MGKYPFWPLRHVWIELILLKLKTYYWNYCSKIIFKCVNSIVGPIFNEKVIKKWNLWVYKHKQYIIHYLRQKNQHLLLLFIKQYINSNHVFLKRVKKKIKKKKKQRRRENAVPKLTLFLNFIEGFLRWVKMESNICLVKNARPRVPPTDHINWYIY